MADLGTATAFDGDPPFATESQVETALANGLLFAAFYLPSATGAAACEGEKKELSELIDQIRSN